MPPHVGRHSYIAMTLDKKQFESIQKIEDSLSIYERIAVGEWELRKEVAKKILSAFTIINFSILMAIALLTILDAYFIAYNKIHPESRIIDSGVIMSVIAATTAQFAAIAVTVSNWLFPKRP